MLLAGFGLLPFASGLRSRTCFRLPCSSRLRYGGGARPEFADVPSFAAEDVAAGTSRVLNFTNRAV